MAMMHYSPQLHISVYEPMRKRNYDTAISYYRQKRMIFERQFYQALSVEFEQVRSAFNQTLEREWVKKIELLTKSVQSHPINDGKSGYYYTVTKQYTPGEDSDVDRIVSIVSRRGARNQASNPKGLLGQAFEPFVKNKIFDNDNLDKAITAKINDGIGEIVTEIVGNKTSLSALSGASTQIGPDVMISFGGSNLHKSKGILYGGSTNVPIELQTMLELDFTNPTDLSTMMINYLKSNLAGMNLKYFTNPNSKTFTKSVLLQNRMNEVFRQRADGTYHTWEEDYATEYANWQVSKDLINLINPNVVAVVMGSGFQWTDEFLQAHILRMRIQRRSAMHGKKKIPFNSHRNGQPSTETLPIVCNSEVYIQTISAMQRMQLIQKNRSGGRIKVKNTLSAKP